MVSRRQFLASTTVSAAAIQTKARKQGDKPNLLFFLPDEWRADTMAVYGNNRFRVPTLNRLGSKSIVFDRAYVTQPVCTPSRASILTGLRPRTHGCITNSLHLRPETKTLPELVNDSAYRTAYMGKWHLGDEQFAQHGFQDWVSIEDYKNWSPGRDRKTRSSYSSYLESIGYKPTDGNTFHRGFTVQLPIQHCKAAFVADNASDWILKNKSEPWILYAAFLEPHAPFHGPLNDLHSAEEAPLPANYPGFPVEKEPLNYTVNRQDSHVGHYYDTYKLPGHQVKTKEDFQRLNRNYAGLCSQADQAVAKILWALEASGQAENTIIVFTADHGSMMGSHSLIGKEVLYEESVRVPWLIHAPFRQHAPLRYDRPVSHIDLVPTVLDLMGCKVPEFLEGETLVPALQGVKRRNEWVQIEWNEPPKGPNARAVVSPDGYKMAVYDTDNSLLFHRPTDPLEMRNLYYRKENAAVVKRLTRQLG